MTKKRKRSKAASLLDVAPEIATQWHPTRNGYFRPEGCVGDTKDRYGRLIANCFVDGYNVNARLVYEGLALAYRKYSKQYVPEEDKARAAKRGMWAGEFVPPWIGERAKG